jgi:hypothetical protein
MKTTLFFNRTRTFSAALLLLCFAACNQGSNLADNTRRRAVDPSLQNDVPFRDFTISADKSDTITLAEGTQLYIPSGIFVAANGQPVKGEVQLHYRAFYTPGEIIASGISMFYDSANTEHVFTSAGMFELTGTQNGNPIAIAPGKSIDMDFASSRDDATYSFYQMDTAKAEWKYITTDGKAQPNAMREELMAEIAKTFGTKPAEPKLYDPKKPVINIDVDTKDHPELAGYEGILWQYAGSGTDPEKNKWIYETDWMSAQLTVADSNTCMYGINLSAPGKSFKTNVFPSLKGDDYQAAMTEFKSKVKVFEAAEAVRQEKRTNVALTAQFQRRTRITNFGICNWDRFEVIPEFVNVEFHFEDPEFERQRENVAIYFVALNGRVVAGYNGAGTPNLQFASSQKSGIVAVLRGTDKIAKMTNNEFLANISPDKAERSVFKMRTAKEKVTNSKELDAVIAGL